MPVNFRLSTEAEVDVTEGYEWYESKREGLGEEFLEALDQAVTAICNNPNTYRVRYKKKVRAFIIRNFPYLILYVVNGDNIDVIAVFNTNKNPQEWKQRV